LSTTKHRSASPSSTPAQPHAQQKSRLSRQVHPPPTEDEDDMDVDGEGDDDDGEVEDDNDERLYCFCRKQSYGDVCPLPTLDGLILSFVLDDRMRQ